MPSTDAAARDAAVPILLRFAAYTLMLLGALAFLLWLLMQENEIDHDLFREGNVVEWTQFALVAAASLLLLFGGYRWRDCAPVLWCLSILAAIAAVRELDSHLGAFIPVLGWKLPAGALVVALVACVWRQRGVFWPRVLVWLHTPAFGVFWAGAIMVLVFAQLMGQADLWKGMMGDNYERAFKRVVEESAELFGYTLLFIGAIESVILAPRLSNRFTMAQTQSGPPHPRKGRT